MRIRIRFKILLVFMLLAFSLLIISFVLITGVVRSNLFRQLEVRINRAGEIVSRFVGELRQRKQQDIMAFANIAELNRALKEEQELRLPFILQKYYRGYGFDCVQLYNRYGNITGEAGRRMPYETIPRLRALLAHGTSCGLFVQQNQICFISVGRTEEGEAIVVGKTLLDDRVARRISDTVSVSLILFLEGKVTAQAFVPGLEEIVPDKSILEQAGRGEKRIAQFESRGLTLLYAPFHDHNEKILGAMLLGLSTQVYSRTRAEAEQLLFNIMIGGALLSLLVAYLFSRQLTNPIQKLTAWAGHISGGDLNYKTEIRTNDEINELAHAFTVMIANLKASFNKIRAQNIELTKMDRLKSDLISNVSHELRTPITTIYGCMEMLVSGEVDDPETLRDFYHSLFEEVSGLRRIITNFLMLSILDKQEHYVEEIGLRDFVRAFVKKTVRQELGDLLRSRRLSFKDQLSPLLSPNTIVRSDRDYLHHILYELIHNAIVYNRSRGKIVLAGTKHKGKLDIRVEDSGIGIPGEELSRVCDNFHKVDGGRTQEYPGIGLGLSTVRQICDSLGYRLRIESEVGKYTRVTVAGIPYSLKSGRSSSRQQAR